MANPSNMQCLIAENTVCKGDILFSDGIHIDGKVIGNISANPDATSLLVVSRKGRVTGNVRVQDMMVNGRIEGSLHVSGTLKIYSDADLRGDIVYGKLEIETGAVINGRLLPLSAQATAPTRLETRKDIQGVA